ncbi:MAG: thioredoxin family protein [Candidatus Sumerlaeaceae bacterium]|nr:thioredoxin family protein [Candidatus Sumerlaeaceae bacterium]
MQNHRPIYAMLGLAMSVALLATSALSIRAQVSVGAKAPDFSLPDALGTTHTLSQYRGKIVVLEWTNPTCPFVKRHYKSGTMKKLAEKYADKQVVWLAIDSSHFVQAAEAKKWQEEQKLPYSILLDPSGEVGQAYGAKTTPHMYIISKDGTIAYAGAIDDDPRGDKADPRNYVDEALAKLVAGQEPEVTTTQPYGCSVKYKK